MLDLQRLGQVRVATLSRPPVNALDGALLEQLEAALDAALADEATTVLHLRSDQRAFCAGADLALMRSALDTAEGRETMIRVVERMQRLFTRVEDAPVVTLAEIGGAAMGGGLELALACDLRVAAVEAKLGLPEAGLGLLPAAGGTQRLARLCGEATAKRLILGAAAIDGAEALRLGLVQWARPRNEVAAWTRALAARIAELPKFALASAKRCIGAQRDSTRDGFAEEIAATRALYDDPETRRRVSAFLAKRTT
ncbi:MAG TPA: enoyl-CoA hydratase/isomerase family protein [Casimicrobiaceae bacterium]|nr:enoyl-CoA hydratase/isomerase family protein [Casimicrobiaceae bacterium]